MSTQDKLPERARFNEWLNHIEPFRTTTEVKAAWEGWQAHAAEAAHPQPAQDASKYQELLMAVSKKFPNESRHETALRYIKQTELQSCEPKCDAAMAKESGR